MRGQAALATGLTALAAGSIVLCAGLLAHAVLGRRRLASWDAGWQVTEPQWTQRPLSHRPLAFNDMAQCGVKATFVPFRLAVLPHRPKAGRGLLPMKE